MFIIENIIDLQTGDTSQIGHEPNNELVQYYLDGDRLRNRVAIPNMGNYSGIQFADETLQRFTTQNVNRFAIKTFPQIGAVGAAKLTDESVVILTPINYRGGLIPPGIILIGQTNTTITYSITQPELFEWEAFRFVFTHVGTNWRYEFITYSLEGEFEKLVDMEGEFGVTIQGFRNEIQEFSRIVEWGNINITLRDDSETELFFLNTLPRKPNVDYLVLADGIIQADKIIMA